MLLDLQSFPVLKHQENVIDTTETHTESKYLSYKKLEDKKDEDLKKEDEEELEEDDEDEEELEEDDEEEVVVTKSNRKPQVKKVSAAAGFKDADLTPINKSL